MSRPAGSAEQQKLRVQCARSRTRVEAKSPSADYIGPPGGSVDAGAQRPLEPAIPGEKSAADPIPPPRSSKSGRRAHTRSTGRRAKKGLFKGSSADTPPEPSAAKFLASSSSARLRRKNSSRRENLIWPILALAARRLWPAGHGNLRARNARPNLGGGKFWPSRPPTRSRPPRPKLFAPRGCDPRLGGGGRRG